MSSQYLTDMLDRPMRDLRISVTDRCNFRCVYCMPRDVFGAGHQFLDRSDLLSYEEIIRVAHLFARLGVNKIRLTGGEPLLRHNLEVLIAGLSAIESIADIGLTTNGMLLPIERAGSLYAAGLKRITVSLDGLSDKVFGSINGMGQHVAPVLTAIDDAIRAGFAPVKVNMVVMKGVNDQEILPVVEYFQQRDVVVRFIEFMDVGNSNDWHIENVMTGADVVAMIDARYPLQAVASQYRGEVATRWQFKDGSGEIGVINSVSQPFCSDCSRMRLSAEGKLYTCLFTNEGLDLRTPLRQGISDRGMLDLVSDYWAKRQDRYSEFRSEQSISTNKIEMSYIGG